MVTKALLPLAYFIGLSLSAPTISKNDMESIRQQKSLPYFDYYQPEEMEYNPYEVESDDYINVDLNENDLSRTIPSRKNYPNRPHQQQSSYNSPIYYIRLPPQPYMFIPGLGYVSQPSPHPMNQFLNVPVSFVANGKPSTIYQWSGLQQFPNQIAPSPPVPILPPSKPSKPKPEPADSTVHRLPGKYQFNGKPDDIYVLRDSYNSLYSDALQNFYP